jgi:hypothetical protein
LQGWKFVVEEVSVSHGRSPKPLPKKKDMQRVLLVSPHDYFQARSASPRFPNPSSSPGWQLASRAQKQRTAKSKAKGR